MKNKITITVITIILLIILIILIIKPNNKMSNKKEEFTYTPLLYKICDDDSCIYLLGSIHLGDERINKFSNIIIDSYKESDSLAVEVDISDITLDINDFMLENGTIEDYISSELKNKLINFSDNHPLFVYDTLKYMKLGYVYDYISLIPYMENGYNNEGVDSYFINLAKTDNKKIVSLETDEDQLNLLLGYSDEFYIKQIEEIIDDYEEVKDLSIDLYNAYLESDEKKLQKIIDEDIKYETEEERQYIEDIHYNRNINMANNVEEFLKNNDNVFMTVGSAHVIGNNGIIDLLKDRYKISIVK